MDLLKPKFNCNPIAGSPLGTKHTLQSRLNMSKAHKGKTLIEKEKIIEGTLKSGSTVVNPRRIDRDDVEFILKEIF